MFRIKLLNKCCKIAFGGLTLFIIVQSCQRDPCGSTADNLIDNLENLVTDVKDNDFPSKDPRWDSYDKRFEIIYEDCYDRLAAEMTGQQKKEFATLAVRYMAKRLGKPNLKSLFKKFNQLPEEREEMPELGDEYGSDIQKFFEDAGTKGSELLKDFYNDAKEWLESEKRKK